jgi:hypothetical protein
MMPSNSLSKDNIDANFLLALQATFLSHQDFSQAATALATDLAIKLGLERVSIGLIEQNQAIVKAISHTTDITPKYEAIQMISAAMNEATEQAIAIVHPKHIGTQPYVVLAHTKLVRGTGNQVCTIPLIDNGNIFGAITMERNATHVFSSEGITTLESMSTLLAPILQLKWKSNQPLFTRLIGEWSNLKNHLISGENSTARIAFYSLILLALLSLFVPINYNISAPARLEGSIQRALVAPEDGYLEQAFVRPGDNVSEGQPLAALADQELLLAKRRWESELAQFENAYGASLAQSDRVQMAINQSKAEVARTELILVEEKLSRSHIVAPFDGIIIKGDLVQSLGAPIKRGATLLSISPSNSFRLIIEVDEKDISTINLNQQGQVALVSLPGKKIPFKVERITPIATTKEGRNFFEVEGDITPDEAILLRPGLEGVAKIRIGKRPLIWTLTHRITDWLSITFWSWGL